MKLTTALFLLALNGNLISQYSSISSDIDLILADDYFKTCQIAIDIYDLSEKKIVYRKNSRQLFHPASNMKIISSAAGLYFLSPEYEFITSIWHDGEIADSILAGNLYYVGGFDPDFTTKDLDSLSAELVMEGIARIDGDIIGDVSMMDSLFWGNGWMWDDDPSTDFPYMTPLVINDAAVIVEYMPGELGSPAIVRTIPESGYFVIENNSVTVPDSGKKFRVTRDWIERKDKIIIEGELDTGAVLDTAKLNLVNSTDYFLSLAKESLLRNGIEVKGEIEISNLPEDAESLLSFSRSYSNVIVNLNKESDNLSAEMTLRALSRLQSGKSASAEEGLELVDSMLTIIGLDPEEYRLEDGSGVSHYNLVTAEMITDILKYFYFEKPGLYELLRDSFPVSGSDGTLKERMETTEAFEKVYAKTGTLSGVSCLSGYIFSRSETEFAFSILMQNFVGSADSARSIQDKICEVLSGY